MEIGALGLVTAATIDAFWKVRRSAAVLLVPLFAWVCFAAALNAWIVVQN